MISPTESPSSAAVETPPRPVRVGTWYDLTAWILLALGLLVTLSCHLTSALAFGPACVRAGAPHHEAFPGLPRGGARAKVAALVLVSAVLVAICAGIVILIIGLVQGRVGDMPALFHRMSLVVETFRDSIKSPSVKDFIPEAENLHARVVAWLHANSQRVSEYSGLTARILVHSLLGIVIGAFLCFHVPKSGGPLSTSFNAHIRRS